MSPIIPSLRGVAARWLSTVALACFPLTLPAQQVLVEAESFADSGGWSLDTQFIEIMGSPYLLAHGLGEPVKDASTTVELPATGTYRVWVRTKDWVARWQAPGTPGRFQVLIEGQPLAETFGTRGADWHWQDGGQVRIQQPRVRVALHDLTGFDGRCDALLFSKDPNFTPPNDSTVMAAWRRTLLHLPEKPAEIGPFDLVVIGGGYAGTAAALSAARLGCKVALIQERPVLGGNGSSEIRVWPQGLTRVGRYPHLGEIVEELALAPKESPGQAEEFGDAKKNGVVQAEKNLTLFLNHHAYAVETNGHRLTAILVFDTQSGQTKRFTGRFFADCTGHGTIGALAGADHTTKDTGHMGMSNMWRWRETDRPAPFPEVPWALDLDLKDFPYPTRFHGPWFWETGFDQDPVRDLEAMRDWNLRAVFGAFNAMKNRSGSAKHLTARLEWIAYIGGTRESRQLLGDVILTGDDIRQKRDFPDGCVPTTWSMDLHYPDNHYTNRYPDNPFISRAEFGAGVDKRRGYPVPYRCFYSRNLANLFMAGRCVSVNHEALGTVRVMKTGGMMGEVVGKAVSVCLRRDCSPRAVYEQYFEDLKQLMSQPGALRRDTLDGPLSLPPNAVSLPPPPQTKFLDPATLPGVVVDDERAKLTGTWTAGEGLSGFVGDHYLYASRGAKAVARFEFQVPATGRYEVRVAHQPHANRATNTPITVLSADGPTTLRVNQRVAPPLPPTFVSLGSFRFEAGRTWAVEISNDGANGLVHADAIQVLPAGK